MSFVHDVRVGFFGVEDESQVKRDLSIEECELLFNEFSESAPDFLDIEIPSTQGNAENVLIGKCDGQFIILRRGVLYIPYYSVEYFLASITFGAFVALKLGCSIYSEDKGDFITVQEFIPHVCLSEALREYFNKQSTDTEFR